MKRNTNPTVTEQLHVLWVVRSITFTFFTVWLAMSGPCFALLFSLAAHLSQRKGHVDANGSYLDFKNLSAPPSGQGRA